MNIRYVLLFMLSLPLFMFAREGRRESITYFQSDVVLNTDGSLNVQEQIDVHAVGEQVRHGIFRVLPLERKLNSNRFYIHYSDISALRDGKPENIEDVSKEGLLTLYLGDEEKLLPPGDYRYTLKYRVDKAIGSYESYDELYWNAIGNKWSLPIDSAKVMLTLPKDASVIGESAHTGMPGSGINKSIFIPLGNNKFEWKVYQLRHREGLTFSISFKKGVIVEPANHNGRMVLAGCVLSFVIICLFYFFTWRRYGKDPQCPSVYPHFTPPGNMSPAMLSVRQKESVEISSFSATLTNLAIKGYVQIKDNQKSSGSFVVTRLGKADDYDYPEEKVLMDNLFSSGDTVCVNGQYNEDIKNAYREFKESVLSQNDDSAKEKSNFGCSFLAFLIAAVSGHFLTNMYYAGDIVSWYSNIPSNMIIMWGGWLVFMLFFLISKRGDNSFKPKVLFLVFATVLFFGYGFYSIPEDRTLGISEWALTLLLIFYTVSLPVYTYLIKRPSKEKVCLLSEIAGFELYLRTAEVREIQFFNPPKMTPKLFEFLLPYAIAFGVQDVWGERFKKTIVESDLDPENFSPTWYFGTSLLYSSLMKDCLTSSIGASMTHSQSFSDSDSNLEQGSSGRKDSDEA